MESLGALVVALFIHPFWLASKAWDGIRYLWWHWRNPGICPHCGGDGYTMEKPYGKVICGECND